MTSARKNSAGFTLMEVVVATALMALVMTIVFMGLRIAANAWHRGEQKLEQHSRALSGTDAIERQVAAAVPWSKTVMQDNKAVELVGFSGSASEARFITRESWRGAHDRPQYLADYRVIRQEGRQQLVIAEQGLMDDSTIVRALGTPLPADVAVEAIGEPADAVELSYYQPATPKSAAAWVSEWAPQPGGEIPPAVRIRWVRPTEVREATFLVAISHKPEVRP